MPKSHFDSIDLLRGLAALAVGLFHITSFLRPDNPLRVVCAHGHLGVECFFVISGFIIPYTLWKKQHRIGHFPRFMLARVLRLHPAYLGSVALMLLTVMVANILPPPFHRAATVDWGNAVLHFFYLSELCGKPWLNGVYWSLAIEMQYYVLLGVAYAVLWRAPRAVVGIGLALFAGSAFFSTPSTVFYYGVQFVPGMLLFFWYIGRLREPWLWLLLAVDVLLVYWQRHEWFRPGAVLAACGFIRYVRWRHPAGVFCGRISYSFYLLHTTVAFALLENALPHVGNEGLRTLLVLVGVLLAIVAATWYHRLVEEPTRKLASRVGGSRLAAAGDADDRPQLGAGGG